jgi:hypothetical protein
MNKEFDYCETVDLMKKEIIKSYNNINSLEGCHPNDAFYIVANLKDSLMAMNKFLPLIQEHIND